MDLDMNWDKLLRFMSYYGLRFKFGYDEENVHITLEYRDEHVFYDKTKSFPRRIFDDTQELGKSVIVYNMMESLAKWFELEGKEKRII